MDHMGTQRVILPNRFPRRGSGTHAAPDLIATILSGTNPDPDKAPERQEIDPNLIHA